MAILEPHDLLWGMQPQHLSQNAPDWVYQKLVAQHPVVVRRDITQPKEIAVGIRGEQRHQRYATTMPIDAITQQVKPESLKDYSSISVKFQQQLLDIEQILNVSGYVWGFTGSVGFELATSITTIHENSDFDILLRTPDVLSRDTAKQLLAQLQRVKIPIDVQLQTPRGGVALKEWAEKTGQVLLKQSQGAILVEQPW